MFYIRWSQLTDCSKNYSDTSTFEVAFNDREIALAFVKSLQGNCSVRIIYYDEK